MVASPCKRFTLSTSSPRRRRQNGRPGLDRRRKNRCEASARSAGAGPLRCEVAGGRPRAGESWAHRGARGHDRIPICHFGQGRDRHLFASVKARRPASTRSSADMTISGGRFSSGIPATPQNSVRVAPGSTARTRTPWPASSCCSASAMRLPARPASQRAPCKREGQRTPCRPRFSCRCGADS